MTRRWLLRGLAVYAAVLGGSSLAVRLFFSRPVAGGAGPTIVSAWRGGKLVDHQVTSGDPRAAVPPAVATADTALVAERVERQYRVTTRLGRRLFALSFVPLRSA